MRLFINENAVKAKASDPVREAFIAPSNPLADVIGCNSCRFCILYEQFSHKCYSLKSFSC